MFFLAESRVFVASCYIIKEGKGEWEARLRLRHQKDALGSTQGQGGGVNRKERNVVTGFELEALGGQERGRRRAVVSHSSPGHARANGSSQPPHPPLTPLHSTLPARRTHSHDTHEDMLTHFCLRGCGKPTLPGKGGEGWRRGEEKEGGGRGGGRKWVRRQGEGRMESGESGPNIWSSRALGSRTSADARAAEGNGR